MAKEKKSKKAKEIMLSETIYKGLIKYIKEYK